MGWDYDTNIYDSPEKFGLKIIGSMHDPHACWSFDDFVVWQHEDGTIYCAEDSGCSCPSPFENFDSIDDLEVVSSWEDLLKFTQEWVDRFSNYDHFQDYEMERHELLKELSSYF